VNERLKVKDLRILIFIIYMLAINCTAFAEVINPLDAEPDGSTGSNESTFVNAGGGHTAAPAGWSGVGCSIDVYRDAGKNAAIGISSSTSTNYSYTAQFATSTPALPNTEYRLCFLAGSHVNLDFGTAGYTVTFGTINNGTFYRMGSVGPVTVTFNGNSTYLGDSKGVYLTSFSKTTGATVPAGNVAVRIAVTANGVSWPAMDNFKLQAGVFPVITVQPISQIVETAGTVTLTVSGSGITSYRWYKGLSQLNDGGNISGATTPTLTITNCQAENEGEYYCKVSGECSAYSSKAALLIRRMIAHWPFDGNLNDISGSGNNGTAVGTMIYKTGVNNIANGALYLENLSGAQNYVKIANPVYSSFGADLISYCGSFTLSLWIKPSFVQSYEMYVSTGLLPNGGWYAARYGSGYVATCLINPIVNGFSSYPFNDGNWHLFTAVVNAQAGTVSLYMDKEFQNQKSAAPTPGVDFLIGALNSKATRGAADNISYGYTGLIDDIRMYNYPLGQNDINQMFDIVKGDINHDCVVDIADLAVVIQNWMVSNRVPASNN
jgi:hypothetical protein